MANLRNSVTLIGNLGKDPEMKAFEGNKKKATISLATSETYRNQKGEKIKDTQWHYIVMWGHLADIAEKFLKKGSEVAIEGRLVYRTFEDTKGEKRYQTEINANELVLLQRK